MYNENNNNTNILSQIFWVSVWINKCEVEKSQRGRELYCYALYLMAVDI